MTRTDTYTLASKMVERMFGDAEISAAKRARFVRTMFCELWWEGWRPEDRAALEQQYAAPDPEQCRASADCGARAWANGFCMVHQPTLPLLSDFAAIVRAHGEAVLS